MPSAASERRTPGFQLQPVILVALGTKLTHAFVGSLLCRNSAITFLLIALIRAVTQKAVPSLRVKLSEADAQDTFFAAKHTPSKSSTTDQIPCCDPGNMQLLGHLPALTSAHASRV
ncbi:hypothetical protein WJX79_004241 [Trebouxia sp. C0005]